MGDVCMNLTVDKANLILNGFGKAIKKTLKISLSFRQTMFGLCHILAFSTSPDILKLVVLTTAGISILLHLHLRLQIRYNF